MIRTKKVDEKMLYDAMMDVFTKEKTTAADRQEIVSRWLAGENECYMELATAKSILPIALITACLIDAEHPILAPNGRICTRSISGLAAVILNIELIRSRMTGTITPEMTSDIALRLLIRASPSADNLIESVEKSSISVDNLSG